MEIVDLAKLGMKHVANHAAQALYLHSGMNWTRPTNFCGLVTPSVQPFLRLLLRPQGRRSSERDEFCGVEASLAFCQGAGRRILYQLQRGEVMLMKWFPDLLHHCNDNGIKGGVLTNDTAINDKTAPRLVAAEPFEIALSIDGPNAGVHDLIRGRKGSFAMVTRAVSLFRRERDRQGKKFPIIIRCVINKFNLHGLPAMVDLLHDIGGTAIIFQPVHEITEKVMTDWQKERGVSSDSLRENFWIGLTSLIALLAGRWNSRKPGRRL